MQIIKPIKQRISAWLPLSPFTITLIYLLSGSIWMLISDRLLNDVVVIRTNFMLLQLLKDWLYVVSTAAVLFALIERLQLKIHRGEEKYRLLIEHMPDGVAILHEERVIFSNPALVRMLGLQHRNELIDRSLIDFATGTNSKQYLEILESDDEYRTVMTLERDDSQSVIVEVTSIPVQELGEADYQLVLRDISAYKRMEAERQAAYESLEERVRQRTREIRQQQRIAESLSDTLAILNSNKSLDETLDHIAIQATTLLNNDADAVFRLNAAKNTLTIKTSRGLPKTYIATTPIPIRQEIALSEA
ncbi:MAG: PAS domain-containing protein, partial [Anaerolineae bacterium]|nr:PAS domain-containing protein [Anaerolineae bacterium]